MFFKTVKSGGGVEVLKSMYIGQAGTYNLSDQTKPYYAPDYNELTNDNFVLSANSGQSSSRSDLSSGTAFWGRFDKPSFSYNSSTGVLTVNNGKVALARSGADLGSGTITCNCYLIRL